VAKLLQPQGTQGKKWKRGSGIHNTCFARCFGSSITGHQVFPVHTLRTAAEIGCFAQRGRGEREKGQFGKHTRFSIRYKATATTGSTTGQRAASVAHQVQFKAHLNEFVPSFS